MTLGNRRHLIVSLAAAGLMVFAAFAVGRAGGERETRPCSDDAMLVFDASGSMSGDGWGYGSESPSEVSRMDKVRHALAKVLPSIARIRRVGLITYGPGPYNQCNVHLDLAPSANAADRIMQVVDALVPAGRTPLTSAVEQAANVLDYRNKPGVIVLLTDGEETCGRQPCELGKALHAVARHLTVHVIGLRVKGYSWTGEQSILDVKCLADENEGLYITVEQEDELIAALEKTLGCPMLSRAAP